MHRFNKWRETLQTAASERAVRRTLLEYANAIPATTLSMLPKECGRALTDSDLASAAVTLLQTDMLYRGDPEVGQVLHEIADTFAAASVRLGQLRNEPSSSELLAF